jgi:type IV secretory pathway TrbD component
MTTKGKPHAMLEHHRVYHVVNRPLTIWGVERRLWLFAAMLGGATFNGTGSLVGGLLSFLVLYALLRAATARDPQLLVIIARASRYRQRYDASKHVPFMLVVRGPTHETRVV